MLDRFDIINSPDFFRNFIEKKYLINSKDPDFLKEFPTLNSYVSNAKLFLRFARDKYVEKFFELNITDTKYIVETMLNFSNFDIILNVNFKKLTDNFLYDFNLNNETEPMEKNYEPDTNKQIQS